MDTEGQSWGMLDLDYGTIIIGKEKVFGFGIGQKIGCFDPEAA